jgi:hypothetical protein
MMQGGDIDAYTGSRGRAPICRSATPHEHDGRLLALYQLTLTAVGIEFAAKFQPITRPDCRKRRHRMTARPGPT